VSLRRWSPLVAIAALGVSACGGIDDSIRDEGAAGAGPAPMVSPATEPVATTDAGLAPTPAPGVAVVYFLRFDRPAPSRRSVPEGLTVAEAGVQGLLEGPTPAERLLDYATAIPAGATLLGYSEAGRVATIDVSELPQPSEDRDDEALLALYQLVYTATAGGTVDGVRVRVRGQPYGLGVITGGSSAGEPPVTRADLGFVASAETAIGSAGCTIADPDEPTPDEPETLVVTRPLDGAVARGAIRVRGRVQGEGGPIVIRVLRDGVEVAHRIVDERCRGPFAASLPVPRGLAGAVVVDVTVPDADGEPRLSAQRLIEVEAG
jgi:hypothetical protein